MLRTRQITGAGCMLLAMSGAAHAQPAFTGEDRGEFHRGVTSRAPFAGATFRLEMGRGARPASTRLQLGMRSVMSGRQSEAPPGISNVPLLELGLAGRERGTLLIAGQPTNRYENELGLKGDAKTAVVVAFSVALLAVGLLVITNLNSLDNDGQN